MSAEAGPHTFHVLNVHGVAFLTLAERSYPKKLAFQYLDELSNEFNRLYGGQQVESVSRPYAFIKFGALLWLSWTVL
jgi:vesicle transport protein SEC22